MPFNPTYPHDLALLPPSVNLKNTDVLDLLISARAELGELKGYSFSMPNQLLLLSPAIIKESLASSEIENINTTLINVLENQLFPEEEQRPPDKEVLRYRDAVLWGFDQLAKYGLTTRTILGTQHKLIPSSVGEYRKVQNGIKNFSTGEITYMPPVSSNIPSLMGNLENYIGLDNSLDPLINCAVMHYQFEAIHPFSDGNGRTGRILMVLYLVSKSILSYPTLYISGYINDHRSEYYRLLLEVTTKNNWHDYICFMLKGFHSQAIVTKKFLFEILSNYHLFKDNLKKNHKKIYSADLVDALFSAPVITPGKLANDLDIWRDTASRYLKELTQGNILVEKKTGRYHLYINKELIKVLHG